MMMRAFYSLDVFFWALSGEIYSVSITLEGGTPVVHARYWERLDRMVDNACTIGIQPQPILNLKWKAGHGEFPFESSETARIWGKEKTKGIQTS